MKSTFVYPRTKAGWLQIAFSASEALVLGMSIRLWFIMWESRWNHFSVVFYTVYFASVLILLFLLPMLDRVRRIVGYITLGVVVLGGGCWSAMPIY